MPAVAKKVAKAAKNSKSQKQQQNDVEAKKPKKQSLKKVQKTAGIVAAKKLAKLNSKKAVSDTLNRAPAVKKQKAKHQFDPTRLNRGLMLIQNLPKGFYEKQLKKYFTQYGRVTRLRLARSERTGGSKGYAYIEFKHPEVAQVAAESMNGYLMFRQRLKTVYIPPAKQDHDYFKQPVKFVKTKSGKTKLITPKTVRVAETVKKYNKRVSVKAQAERAERDKYKLQFLQKKLAKAGINIDLSGQLYTTATPDATNNAPSSTVKKAGKKAKQEERKENESPTLQNLLESTIQSSDEEDDDYEPSPEEIAEADKFVNSLLNEESNDENDTTLNRFLNNTLDSDESDDEDGDYEPSPEEMAKAKAVAQKAAKKLSKIDSTKFISTKLEKNSIKKDAKKVQQKKQKVAKGNDESVNDTTLDRLLNKTIDSDESEGDDYEPTPQNVQKTMASTNKPTKKDNNIANSKTMKKEKRQKFVEITTNKEQKKRKIDSIETQKPTQQETPPKKKKSKMFVKTSEPLTPKPQKMRKNFVAAPTPESIPKKKKNKNKSVNENVTEISVKIKKTKKIAVTAPKNDLKKGATPKATISKSTNSATIKTKSFKKGNNKKK